MKKRNKLATLFDKITEEYDSKIIFGILSGVGLAMLMYALAILITTIFSILQPYTLIIYLILYLFPLIFITRFYTKGLFRIIFLISSLIIAAATFYGKIFGGAS